MTKELSFCPFCSAPEHKLLNHQDELVLCRACDTFFSCTQMELTCPKCESHKIVDSEFPGPKGEIILQCKACKKMFSAEELVKTAKKVEAIRI